MPTATTTLTTLSPQPTPLKPGLSLSSPPALTSSSSSATTLRSLYNRAARAFLHRDVPLTHSLLSSAFSILSPPPPHDDPLAAHRRKWDILRITLETTVYSSPPPQSSQNTTDTLPTPLRDNLILSPHFLLTSLHARSLDLFTPAPAAHNAPRKPDAAFLPPQVLITLVYSSLKLDCPDIGRVMIEDWLARRGSQDHYGRPDPSPEGESEGYEKVLDLYCLHVLPKLNQWAYAKEFLEYESELPSDRRDRLIQSLASIRTQHIQSTRRMASPPPTIQSHSIPPLPGSPRAYSPAPSSTSTDSSLSTTSTHTAVPSTPRPSHHLSSLTPLNHSTASLASSNSNSTATATPRPRAKKLPSHGGITSPTPLPSNLPRSHPQAATVRSSSPPGAYALLRASLQPYLTTPKLTTLLLLFVVFPLVSYILRVRRQRRLAGNASGVATPGSIASVATSGVGLTADLVRRRLQAVNRQEGTGIVGRIWGELVRAVTDTVKMGGSGLV